MAKKGSRKEQNIRSIGSGDSVFVYCGIPQGMTFMAGGNPVTFLGVNSAKLVMAGGADLEHGKFGVTKVEKTIWEEVKKVYGNTDMFKNGVIFAADNIDKGDDEAAEKQEVKVGTEQLEEDEFACEAVER